MYIACLCVVLYEVPTATWPTSLTLRRTGWKILTDAPEYLTFSVIKRTVMVEAVRSSETSGNIYQTTRRNVPEDSHLLTFELLYFNISLVEVVRIITSTVMYVTIILILLTSVG